MFSSDLGIATGIHQFIEMPFAGSATQERLDAARRMTLPLLMALCIGAGIMLPAQVATGEPAKITLEAGIGVSLISEQDFTAQVGINLGVMPEQWWLIGGREGVLFVGKTSGGPWFVAPGIGIAPNTRLGVPVWREGNLPLADVALFYTRALSF